MPTMGTDGSSNALDDESESSSSSSSLSSPRAVMVDIAEWWCHSLLRQTDPSKWDVLEGVLPLVSPIQKDTRLATRLRACALWQEVLWNLTLDSGDFSMLQDKWLLLAKEFNKNMDADYLHVLDVLKVQEQLASLYQGLLESSSTSTTSTSSGSGEDADATRKLHQTQTQTQTALLDSCRADIQNRFGGATHVPEPLKALLATTNIEMDDGSNPATIIRQRIEHLIKEEDGTYSYSQLQSKMQTLLLTWCETSLAIPKLVGLGYRGVTTIQQQQSQEDADKAKAAAVEPMDEESPARSKTAARSKTTTRDGDGDDDEQEIDGRKEPDDEEEEEYKKEEEDETSNDNDNDDEDEDYDPTQKVSASDDDSEETEMAPPGKQNIRSELSFEGSDAEPSPRYARKKSPAISTRRSPAKRKRRRSSPKVPQYRQDTARRQSAFAIPCVWDDDSDNDDDDDDDDGFGKQPHRRRRRTTSPQRTISVQVPRRHPTPQQISRSASSPGSSQRTILVQVPRRHPTPQQISRSASSPGSSQRILPVRRIISSPTGTFRERRRWTEDETDAVIKGVRRMGRGQWVKIKKWAGDRLDFRTNVDIKDRYRVLLKQGIHFTTL